MELNLNNDCLLLGEANFSFSLSLIKHCDPKYITATCYENKEEAIRKYGADCVTHNLNKLIEANCKQVLYEVDACNLLCTFTNGQRFERIVRKI